MSYLNSLGVSEFCNMELPQGEGDKMILRLVARKIGVASCSGLVKRAIQFGSRIAKVSEQTNDKQIKGHTRYQKRGVIL